MKRNVVLAVVAVVALAVVGVVALLSGESGGAGGSAQAVAQREGGAGALPTFSADMPASERAPQALQAKPVVEMQVSGPGARAEPPAARPAGPRRAVSGRVGRASDGTPIGDVKVTVLAPAADPSAQSADAGVDVARSLLRAAVDRAQDPIEVAATGTAADGTFALDV